MERGLVNWVENWGESDNPVEEEEMEGKIFPVNSDLAVDAVPAGDGDPAFLYLRGLDGQLIVFLPEVRLLVAALVDALLWLITLEAAGVLAEDD